MSWADTSGPGYPEFTNGDKTVACDADGITTEERVSGYCGYTSTVWVPIDVLKELLSRVGLIIVPAPTEEKAP